MTTATNQAVTVWLDTTSDDHGWIVDVDDEAGSETLKVFPPTNAGKKKANAYAIAVAVRRGLPVKTA